MCHWKLVKLRIMHLSLFDILERWTLLFVSAYIECHVVYFQYVSIVFKNKKKQKQRSNHRKPFLKTINYNKEYLEKLCYT